MSAARLAEARFELVDARRADAPLRIAALRREDAAALAEPFLAIGWPKPAAIFEGYADEQDRGERLVLVAWQGDEAAGHLSLVWRSDYRPFREAATPEIKDFAVAPAFRRQGVGLYPAYGPAQRLYALRGYLPDGRGLAWNGRTVRPDQQVRADDGLNLYLVKRLR